MLRYQTRHHGRLRAGPNTSGDRATLNPSWWVGKGMKFHGGARSLQEIWYFQKHMQLLIRKLPFSQYSTLNICLHGLIKALKLTENEQLRPAFFFAD